MMPPRHRLVAARPFDETGHAWLMRLPALAGRRDEALRQCSRLRDLLADGLGVEPLRADAAALRGDPGRAER